MQKTEPRVYLLAQTALRYENLTAWLDSLEAGDFSQLGAGLSDMEKVIEVAGRRCYKSFAPGLNKNVTKIRTDSTEFLGNILDQRHGSVLTHGSSVWAFEGVSRVLTHELVRNAIGNGFSQESMRYVRLDNIPFWFPPEIEEDPEGLQIFEESIRILEKQIGRLNAKRWRQWTCIHCGMTRAQVEHDLHDAHGIGCAHNLAPTIDEMPFALKKKYTSLFRRIVPDGIATGIVVSHNMRSLRWIIEQRTDAAAEYEIRKVYNLVAQISSREWPALFQDFETIDTGDGEVKQWKPRNSKV